MRRLQGLRLGVRQQVTSCSSPWHSEILRKPRGNRAGVEREQGKIETAVDLKEEDLAS